MSSYRPRTDLHRPSPSPDSPTFPHEVRVPTDLGNRPRAFSAVPSTDLGPPIRRRRPKVGLSPAPRL